MKQFLILFLFLCSTSIFAQDVIVKKDGSTIVCRVVELTSSEITYKKWGDLNGSNYVMNRSDASAINYQNGKKVNLSEATNLYMPNNQNDGISKLNDNALLAIDANSQDYAKKIKKFKKIGWIGGISTAVAGAVLCGYYPFSKDKNTGKYKTEFIIIGGSLIGIGAIWTTSFLLAAQSAQKNLNSLQSTSLYQQDFKLSNGSSISASIDMLSDHSIGNNTLGVGLRYNF